MTLGRLLPFQPHSTSILMKLDDQEITNYVARLAQIGAGIQKSGLKSGAPTHLWVEKTKHYYTVFELDREAHGGVTKKGPPPIGAVVIRVTSRQ